MAKRLTITLSMGIILFLFIINSIYAYKTFSVIKENSNYTQAILIYIVNETSVKEPLTLIKIYPEKTINGDYSELNNYLKTKKYDEVIMFSNDDITLATYLRNNLDARFLVKIPKKSRINYTEPIENKTPDSLDSITGKSIDNKYNNKYGMIVILLIIIVIIILIYLKRNQK